MELETKKQGRKEGKEKEKRRRNTTTEADADADATTTTTTTTMKTTALESVSTGAAIIEQAFFLATAP